MLLFSPLDLVGTIGVLELLTDVKDWGGRTASGPSESYYVNTTLV